MSPQFYEDILPFIHEIERHNLAHENKIHHIIPYASIYVGDS